MRFSAVFVLLVAFALAGCASASESPSGFDATRLRTGQFFYRTLVNGESAGESEITIVGAQGRYSFTNRVLGKFAQQWEAVARADFSPIAASLSFGEGDTLRPAFEIVYQDGRVSGFAVRRAAGEPETISIDASVPADAVDQRIDWAASISGDLTPGREFSFRVYDPLLGVSDARGRVVSVEAVATAVGTFTAARVSYTIEKPDRAETYQVLVNRSGPRMMLREEFPNGAVIELARVN